MNKKSFVFLGPPGSGKGTQAELLEKELGIPTISLGDLLRQESRRQTELGKKAEEYMKNGGLVPDKIVDSIIRVRLKQADINNGFILDGYPRTEDQLKHLEKILNGFQNICFVFIDISDEEIIKRLSGRRSCACGENYHTIFNPPKEKDICNKCGSKLQMRGDDQPEIIKHRLSLYHEETRPMVASLENLGVIIHIDGEKSIADIQAEIKEKIKL